MRLVMRLAHKGGTMKPDHLRILMHALGVSNSSWVGHRNSFVPGGQDVDHCRELVQAGWMRQGLTNRVFVVTEQGRSVMQAQLAGEMYGAILADRIDQAAFMTASERDSPNSVGFDGLVEALTDNPAVRASASDEFARDLFGLCMALRTELEIAHKDRPFDEVAGDPTAANREALMARAARILGMGGQTPVGSKDVELEDDLPVEVPHA